MNTGERPDSARLIKTPAQTFLGVDLGASSGRVMAGWLDADDRLQLQEIHRFTNEPVTVNDTLCWNFDELIHQIFTGLQRGIQQAREAGRPAVSIGIDSWGVDFGLVDDTGKLVGPVVHYRDTRTNGQMEKVFLRLPRADIFECTGIQFLPFNTIYQLAALKESDPDQLVRARHFMMIADLVAWKLTGRITCEYTNATTTQLYDSRKGEWSREILQALDIPAAIFSPPIRPGDIIGPLLPELAELWGADEVQVTAVATHDTGSAVVAVPAEHEQFAYLSCGTWSLLGTELSQPVITEESLAANFTNEGGACGTIRLLKNIMGLWILQECQRQWKREGRDFDWPRLEQMAIEAGFIDTIIDVDDPRFLPPGDMPGRVRDYCSEHNLRVPASDGEIVCCVLKSLARRYSQVLEKLENVSGDRFRELHMVGGGTQNKLLCRWTAQAINRPVVAGPAEATACGNIATQMLAKGLFANLNHLRNNLRHSFELQMFSPT